MYEDQIRNCTEEKLKNFVDTQKVLRKRRRETQQKISSLTIDVKTQKQSPITDCWSFELRFGQNGKEIQGLYFELQDHLKRIEENRSNIREWQVASDIANDRRVDEKCPNIVMRGEAIYGHLYRYRRNL